MTERTRYEAVASREGAWWVVRVPAIDSVTQVRRLDRAEAMTRDLVHAITDEPSDAFDVTVRPVLPEALGGLVARATDAGARARVQQLEASIATRDAAVALDHAGMTVRDIGRLLGVSYQRVQQLLADPDAAALRVRLERELDRAGGHAIAQ